jgi:hypothetical protein
MDSRINRKNGILIYNWCKQEFGRNPKLGSYPKFIFHNKVVDKLVPKCLGEFDPWKNTIRVWKTPFIDKNRRFLTFINTIIHEFVHYHQDIKVKYQKLNDYQNNPLEIEANRIAKKLQYKCFEEVFRKN